MGIECVGLCLFTVLGTAWIFCGPFIKWPRYTGKLPVEWN